MDHVTKKNAVASLKSNFQKFKVEAFGPRVELATLRHKEYTAATCTIEQCSSTRAGDF